MKRFFLVFVAILALFLPNKAFAGGGLVEWLQPTDSALLSASGFVNPGDMVTVHARVASCKNCPVVIKFDNPQGDDVVDQSSNKTDDNGEVSARITSHQAVVRSIYAEVTLYDGSIYPYSSRYNINFAGKLLYWTPAGYKTVDEFNALPKIHVDAPVLQITNATTLNNNNTTRTVEFKVSSPKGTPIDVWAKPDDGDYYDLSSGTSDVVYAWVDPNKNYYFKARAFKNMEANDLSSGVSDFGNEIYMEKIGAPVAVGEVSQPTLVAQPVVAISTQPVQVVPVTEVKTSSETAVLKQKLEDMQKQLDESKQREAKTESQLNKILDWLKAHFSFFR